MRWPLRRRVDPSAFSGAIIAYVEWEKARLMRAGLDPAAAVVEAHRRLLVLMAGRSSTSGR